MVYNQTDVILINLKLYCKQKTLSSHHFLIVSLEFWWVNFVLPYVGLSKSSNTCNNNTGLFQIDLKDNTISSAWWVILSHYILCYAKTDVKLLWSTTDDVNILTEFHSNVRAIDWCKQKGENYYQNTFRKS